MRQFEAREQITVIDYCDMMHITVFHIPNGGSRNKLEAANLKRQGVRAGVPDLFFPVPRHGYHGMFIEMKYGNNTTTKSQKHWINLLRERGYFVRVCYGAREAIKTIDEYMGAKEK